MRKHEFAIILLEHHMDKFWRMKTFTPRFMKKRRGELIYIWDKLNTAIESLEGDNE